MKPIQEERDHVDVMLDELVGVQFDLEVEGIVDRINGLSRRIRRMFDETLAAFDLTHGEYKVLGRLRQLDPPRRSPGDLAAAAELSSGAMTNRLDQLERAGLVRRLPDPSDRRGVQVELTDKGKQTYETAFAAQAEKENVVASGLNLDEKRALNALLRHLMLAFEQLDGDRNC